MQAKFYPGSTGGTVWNVAHQANHQEYVSFSRQASGPKLPNCFPRKRKPLLLAQEARECLPIDARASGSPVLLRRIAETRSAYGRLSSSRVDDPRITGPARRPAAAASRSPARADTARSGRQPFGTASGRSRQDGPAGVQASARATAILQLTDVPRASPIEGAPRARRCQRGPPLAGVPRREVLRQSGMSSRRSRSGGIGWHDVEPVEEILAEPSRFDGLPQVLVGGGRPPRVST